MVVNYGVILLAAGQILVWAGLFYIFPALLLRWEASLGWSKTELTGALTVALFLSAFVSPLVGRLIDRGYGAVVMTGSALAGGLFVIMLAGVSSKWQFFGLWALIGITLAGCLYEPCFALITRAYGADARKSIITVTLVAGFASSISFWGTHILAEHYGWRNTVQLFGGIVICLGVPLLWFGTTRVESDARAVQQSSSESIDRARTLLTPTFCYLAVAFGMVALVHGITIHHLLFILADRGLTASGAVVVASLIGPMQVAGRVVMMATEQSLSNHVIACVTFAVLGLANMLLFAVGLEPSLVFVFAMLFGGGYGIVSIIRPVIAREVLGGDQFGAKAGLLAMVYLVGSASAPYLGSVIWAFGGYDLVLETLMVLLCGGMILYLKAHRLSTASRKFEASQKQ